MTTRSPVSPQATVKFLTVILAGVLALGSAFPTAARSIKDLEVFYDFSDADGPIVTDRSGSEHPINLEIADPKAVKRSAGILEVTGPTTIRSRKPATRLSDAIRKSGAFSVEAWVRPANQSQEGPARMVTLSKGTNERLFTLGQEKDRFDVRFRTDKTNRNGTPSTHSTGKTARPKLTHVVFVRDRHGTARLFVDGSQATQRKVSGKLQPWQQSFQLGLGNEIDGKRPWLGAFHLVAIYSRVLSPGEITRHFQAGPAAGLAPPDPVDLNADLFEREVAGLLANRCIECHDPASREGKLDLTTKAEAFASKGMIVPGQAEDSLLWELVSTDEMPEDREPLTPKEKDLLRSWIEGGAAWSVPVIDPANYRHPEEPGQIWVRRLTVSEYIETVRAALDIDISEDARELLPADLRADGFSNTAYNLSVDLDHVEAYATLATRIVARLDVARFAKRFSSRRNVNDKDMIDLLSKMGQWLLRGPLDGDEVALHRGITTTVVTAGGDFDEAVSYVVEAMLQSPRFIYRIEKQRGDGSTWPVDGFEMASRLSYALWGASPDQELFQAAEEGRLGSPKQVREQAERMLRDPRAIDQSVRFLSEWLNLDRLRHLRPDPDRFPNWNPVFADDMRRETIAFFKEIVWRQERPLAALLNAPVTFVTPRLATHYRLPLEEDLPEEASSKLIRVNLEKVPSRGGLLTQGSVLTMGGEEASMVTRGLFVFNDLLRGTVNNPPPGLNTEPVATKPGLTHRDVAEDRIADRNCGDCHGKFEPLAFGLEKFDGLGTWREADEHGNPLRDDGEMLVPGTPEAVPYPDSARLMDLLAESDRVAESLTWKLAQFTAGRPLTARDAPILKSIHEEAIRRGGTFQQLIVSIASSDLVRKTPTVAEE